MKIKPGYLLKEVAHNFVVIPVGDIDFDGMITLNESGVFIWKLLEKGYDKEAIINALLDEYNVEREIAQSDTEQFLQTLRSADIIDD